MICKTRRVGAIAAACILIVSLVAGQSSGALAESEEYPAPPPPADQTLPEQALPRFVAEPVIQPLPDDDLAQQPGSLRQLVAEMAVDEDQSRDLQCLAEAVYFEARGEPLAGQLAVARVIVNRTQSPLFPDDYCSVVTQPGQFSFVRGGRMPSPPRSSRQWRRAKAIARIAHQELWESEAQDALFFHATYARPDWARTKLARATIDSHIFYR